MTNGDQVGAVAVIGLGSVGRALATAFARSGRVVVIGVRDPGAQVDQPGAAALGERTKIVTVDEAMRAAAIVVFAVPGPAMRELIDAHADLLSGRIVIDATNNLSDGHGPAALSSLRYLAERAPEAQGFRAFNSIGWENMLRPQFGSLTADLFYAGPNARSRDLVAALIAGTGFRPVYVGDTDQAHTAVDALTTLWFSLAFGQERGRRLAFRLLTDADDRD